MFLSDQHEPGRFVRARPETSEDEMEGWGPSKRPRRTQVVEEAENGNPIRVPSSMQQAFMALVWMSERRTDEEIAAMQIPESEVHLEQLEKKWAEVEREWRELRGFEHEGQALELIGLEYARHSELYLQAKVKLRTRISSAKAIICAAPVGSSAITLGATGQTIQIQMPDPVKVPRFSGQDEDWARFRSTFVAEVHSNSRFNSSQKLRHLLNAIEGRAREILGQWTPDNGSSYEQAWLGLCNAYDNEYNTVQAHLRKINELRQVHRPTCTTIRQVLDTVRSAHRQLQVMLTADQVADHLLIHHIEGLLDAESLSQWSLRRMPTQLPTLTQLYEFLEMRASTLLALQGRSGQVVEQRSLAPSSSTAKGRGEERRPECKLCPGEQHWPFKCVKFRSMSMPERSKYVAEQRMCRNCFSTRHTTDRCPDKKCPRCRAPHNSSLCPSNTRVESVPDSKRLAVTAPSTGAVSSTVAKLQ